MDAIGLVRQDHRRLEALRDRCERTDQDAAELTAVPPTADQVVAAQETLESTTTNLLPKLRHGAMVVVAVTAAAIALAAIARRRAGGR
jgi:hypothetical protein